MTALDNMQDALSIYFRLAIAEKTSGFTQAGDEIELRNGPSSLLQRPQITQRELAQFQEKLVLELFGAFIGSEDLGFELFQFRRDKALAVYRGLLSNVIGRNGSEIRLGNLDEVTKNRIVADL